MELRAVLGAIVFLLLFTTLSHQVIAERYAGCSQVPYGLLQGRACIEQSSCGILDQANAYYLLMNNVSSEATCIWISAENITLDLNQYTIFYDQLDIPAVPNGDFETDDMTGWDMSNSSDWKIIEGLKCINTRYLLLNDTNGSTIFSPPFAVPRGNYTFVVSAFVDGTAAWPAPAQVATISVVRADNGQELPCGKGIPEVRSNIASKNSDDDMTGFLCDFKPSEPVTVRIKINTTAPMRFDYVDFYGFLHPAIAATIGDNPAHQFTTDKPAGVTNIAGPMNVVNGYIIQGNARSGRVIVANGLSHLLLNNLSIYMKDTPGSKGIQHVGTYAAHNVTNVIRNVYIEMPSVGVFYRDYISGAIHVYGPSIVERNTVRTDTAGINIFTKLEEGYTEGTIISDNYIEGGFTHGSMDRNHYAIWIDQKSHGIVRNNVIYGQIQGGINVVYGYENEVYNNTITIFPRCGLRYTSTGTGDRLEVLGIVIRDNPSPDNVTYSTRNRIYNNNVTMIVDPSKMQKDCAVIAMAFRELNRYAFNYSNCGNNSVFNNTFTAINLQPELNKHGLPSFAVAMAFDMKPPLQKEQVYGNLLQSNNVLVRAGMDKNYSLGILMYNNTMRRLYTTVTPAAARMRPYENIYNWDTGGVIFRDNIWENTDPYDYWRDSHTGQLRIEDTLDVKVTDGASPLSGADIGISDYWGNLTTNGTTGQNGSFAAYLTDFEVFSYSLGGKNYNPFYVTVTYGGSSQNRTVYMNASARMESFFFLTGGCIHRSEIAPCNGCVDGTELSAFIDRWKISNVDVTLKEIMEAIGLWKKGC